MDGFQAPAVAHGVVTSTSYLGYFQGKIRIRALMYAWKELGSE
jgi:hypothetical protein